MILLGFMCAIPLCQGQWTNVVFSDDFESGAIDWTKWTPDSPFFEGGIGDITASVVADGIIGSRVVEFTGTVSQQWWAGGTLRALPTFSATAETNLLVSVDRVHEAGTGSASRSALWLMDASRTRFLLFAENRAETHWEFNRSIGEPGDTPTGGGTSIGAFNGSDSPFLNQGLHTMTAVANGQTVKLYLDGTLGAEVRFPYTDIVVQIGSYARANTDTADTAFDNFKVANFPVATFDVTSMTIPVAAAKAYSATIRIPEGSNATGDVVVRVQSSAPSAASMIGSTNGAGIVKFAKGGPVQATVEIQTTGAVGGATLSFDADSGIVAGNRLLITTIPAPTVWVNEDFSAAQLDLARWKIDTASPYGPGPGFFQVPGNFDLKLADGSLVISGGEAQEGNWAGAAIVTTSSFTATEALPLVASVDRVAIDTTAEGGEPSKAVQDVFYLIADDGSGIYIEEDYYMPAWGGVSWWVFGRGPGGTGSGGTAAGGDYTQLPAVAAGTESRPHRIQIAANGKVAEVVMDGFVVGTIPFPVTHGLHVGMGVYNFDAADHSVVRFDNARVENRAPCIAFSPANILAVVGEGDAEVGVTLSRILTANSAQAVTVTSSDPAVASLVGAVDGALTVVFASGGPETLPLRLHWGRPGIATLRATSPNACDSLELHVTVTGPWSTNLQDTFAAGSVNSDLWVTDDRGLRSDAKTTEESAASIVDGTVVIAVTNLAGRWAGFSLVTKDSFQAGGATPVSFEVDRVKLDKVLTTGTGAIQRTGIWASDASRTNFVYFGEYKTWSGLTLGGWELTSGLNRPEPFLSTDTVGMLLSVFGAPEFNDGGNHRLRMVADGSTVRLYLDGVFGTEVPFPVTSGIHFGIGAYVANATDVVLGTFDNVLVRTAAPSVQPGRLAALRTSTGGVEISWSGDGVLQQASILSSEVTWTDVTPTPVGQKLSVPADPSTTARYFRLR